MKRLHTFLREGGKFGYGLNHNQNEFSTVRLCVTSMKTLACQLAERPLKVSLIAYNQKKCLGVSNHTTSTCIYCASNQRPLLLGAGPYIDT